MNALYVPILRAKQGELDALGHLSPRARALTRPILDLPYKEGETPIELQSRIAETTRRVAETWGIGRPFNFDMSRFPISATVDSGESALEFLFLCARQHHLLATPTTAPARDRGLDTDYFDSLAKIVKQDDQGVAVRIAYDTFADPEYLRQTVKELLAGLSVPPAKIDIVLDAGSLAVLPEAYSDAESMISVLVGALKIVDEYRFRGVVFAGSSFPEKFKKTTDEAPLSMTRNEVLVWQRLLQHKGATSLIFGDYGVVFPRESDPEGFVIPPSRIRLTTSTGFLLFKSAPNQYGTLCREAVKHNDFRQIPQCWGLNEIRDTAVRGGDSNATTWVARDTNIHIETMAESIERQMVTAGKWQKREHKSSFPWLQDRLWTDL